ncbi:holo-acyl-carrier-protein synthase [Diplodia corticola]|uniref:Holo-acyl-carrier-protein synthase n=1 Tax=Diplodia corticola TaxID=236234 RepID=A0A1J9QJM9_9PEZI|nr:holo-acyl-carrier-protein synthase [Diplodia corticola]OJD28673.1 holo-acyl-carrier-protein synthase [Diplodia corticola]
MPPRPFPFPLGVGTDICSIRRVQSLLQRATLRRPPPTADAADAANSALPRLHSFLARVFSFHEILLFDARFAGVLQKPGAEHDAALGARAVCYLAGRFAAKEAVIKAVHPRRLLLRDVLVASQGSHPYAIILDKSPELTHVQRLCLNQSYGFSLPVRAEIDAPADWASHPDTDPALEQCNGQVAKLSISHDGDYATAVCLAVVQAESRSRLLDVLRQYQVALANIRILNAQIDEPTRKLLKHHDTYFWKRGKREASAKFKAATLRNQVKQRLVTIRMYSDALQVLLRSIDTEDSAAVSADETRKSGPAPAPAPAPDSMSDPSAVYRYIMRTGSAKSKRRKRGT